MMGWGEFDNNRKKIEAVGKCVQDHQKRFNDDFNVINEQQLNKGIFGGFFSNIISSLHSSWFVNIGETDSSPLPQGFEKQWKEINQRWSNVISEDKAHLRRRWFDFQQTSIQEVKTVDNALPMNTGGEAILSEQAKLEKELEYKQSEFAKQYATNTKNIQQQAKKLEDRFIEMEHSWNGKEAEGVPNDN